jgi:hypothetical protein
MLRSLLLAAAALLTLSACAQRTRPPGDIGVCYKVQPQRDGSLKYFKLPTPQPDLEHCAANLEALRMKFLRLGGNEVETYGAYHSERGDFHCPLTGSASLSRPGAHG